MISKLIKNGLVTTLALGLFTIHVNTAEASSKVMWGKTELKLGQIGKVTILERTQLVKPTSDGKYESVRILYPGDEFRVYQYKGQDGGLYGVGDGSFVRKDNLKVKYETPSKKKLGLVTEKDKAPVIEDVSNNDSTDGWVTIDTGKGIVIRVPNSVSEKPIEELPPVPQEVITAEKAFKKIIGKDYEISIEKKSQIVKVEKDGEDIIYYLYSDGKYENDGKPRHYIMNWETDKETNKLTYELMKSIGFPLSEKEYFDLWNKSQNENKTLDKDKVSVFAIGPHTSIDWIIK